MTTELRLIIAATLLLLLVIGYAHMTLISLIRSLRRDLRQTEEDIIGFLASNPPCKFKKRKGVKPTRGVGIDN